MTPIFALAPHCVLEVGHRLPNLNGLKLFNPTKKVLYIRMRPRSITVSDRRPAHYGPRDSI
jgi:hypothetical protein